MPTPAAASAQSFSSVWAKGRIQLLRYLAILRKRWWVVFLTISLGLCAAAYYVSQMPPAYRSEGQLMVSGQLRLTEGAAYSEELVNFFGVFAPGLPGLLTGVIAPASPSAVAAIAKSLAVIPPASCVESDSRTLFQRTKISGWC